MSEITVTGRGMVELPLGGKIRTLRFRTHELCLLEKQIGKGLLSALNEESLGFTFLRDAIIAGVAHEFISRKGKVKESLTEELVCKWIDGCEEDDNIKFEELMNAVMMAVMGGLPGGAAIVADMQSQDQGNDQSPAPDA